MEVQRRLNNRVIHNNVIWLMVQRKLILSSQTKLKPITASFLPQTPIINALASYPGYLQHIHHHRHNRKAPSHGRSRESNLSSHCRILKRHILVVESRFLVNRAVDALSIDKIDILEVVWLLEEHIEVAVQILKVLGVVRELKLISLRLRHVSNKNTRHLPRKILRHLRVLPHDIGVRSVAHEDEFALRVGLKDAVEQEFTDGERGVDVGEVEGTRVEGAERVGFVDEVHVVWGSLLGGGG